MVGTEFINVTIATDDHNKDSVSVEPGQVIVVVNNGSTSTSYVEVDETPIEDYGQDVLKLDAGKEAHDQGEPSDNDGQRAVHNKSIVNFYTPRKSGLEIPHAAVISPVALQHKIKSRNAEYNLASALL